MVKISDDSASDDNIFCVNTEVQTEKYKYHAVILIGNTNYRINVG
jgi:hypothetical protein